MAPQTDEPSPSAEELFAGFVAGTDDGGEDEFDAFCAEHPDRADSLRPLYANWRSLRGVLARTPRLRPLQERLRCRFEDLPSQSIQLDPESSDGTPFTEGVLGRLSERGAMFGRYRLKDELAAGGQGAIWRVWDEDICRHLAMKVMRGQGDIGGADGRQDVDAAILGRFLEEAQITGQLDHPGIVPVHELGLDDGGRVYFTMKLVRGRTLGRVLELARSGDEGWSRTRVIGVLLKVCEAMAYAHDKGVVHRDLKPGNVMVGRFGEVYVMDWGLARVLGQEDTKDVRIRAVDTVVIHSERRQEESPGSPLLTLDGQALGTLAYMPPEQAFGRLDRMGPHSDVYAIGAMLYQCLAGSPPYMEKGSKVDVREMLDRLQDGPPESLSRLAPNAEAELVAICEKAMERDPDHRYADTSELAADLQAYLEGRVVSAYETGAWAGAKKWAARNRLLAASLAASIVLAIGGTASVGYAESRRRSVAEDHAALATQEALRFKRLSGVQKLEELRRDASRLWPVEPGRIPAYEQWLARADALVADLEPSQEGDYPGHRQVLEELRQRARVPNEDERQAFMEAHPDHEQHAIAQSELDYLAWVGGVRRREIQPPVVELDREGLPETGSDVAIRARHYINLDRRIFGEEPKGLALARYAVEVSTEAELATTLPVLAFALFANGRDEEALVEMGSALDATEPESVARASVEQMQERLRAAIDGVGQGHLDARAGALEAFIASLESGMQQWVFDDTTDDWWHRRLTELVEELESFADDRTGPTRGVSASWGWGIEKRLEFARSIEAETLSGPQASVRWARAIESIRDEDQCPLYAGLVLEPQLGLVPLRRDPVTQLWEFALLQTGDVPEADEDGRLRVEESSALVLVLIPGGEFDMGGQPSDPEGRNFDPSAIGTQQPVHRVRLEPYFLSKYEMTQGQWRRIAGESPSIYPKGLWEIDDRHPVENVSWDECETVLFRLGLTFPTEAQWEYAARAGTSTAWSTGSTARSLEGHANVYDGAAQPHLQLPGSCETWLDDGHVIHSPVGAFEPNPFGLHDVHGNVLEWCLEPMESYAVEVTGPNARRRTYDWPTRTLRGGSYSRGAQYARSAFREAYESPDATEITGLRPCRPLD